MSPGELFIVFKVLLISAHEDSSLVNPIARTISTIHTFTKSVGMQYSADTNTVLWCAMGSVIDKYSCTTL